MKKTILLATIIMAMFTTSSCNEDSQVITPEIGPNTIPIKNGHYTAEILHTLGKVSDPQIHPDGNKILYGVSYTSVKKNKSQRQLFITTIDGQDNHCLTSKKESRSNARWFDGGKKILYIAQGQIHYMNSNGQGASVQLSAVPAGVEAFELSPDGSKIVYMSEVQNLKKPTDVYADLPKAKVYDIDDLMYRHWNRFVTTVPHSFVASLKVTGDEVKMSKAVDILEGTKFELPLAPFSGMEQLSFSPDNKYIAYSCKKLVGKAYAFSTNTDIYLYNIADGSSKNLTKGMMGYDTNPVFSPDGTKLVWLSMERAGYESDKQRMFIMDMKTLEKKELTTDYKYNVESPSWSADSKKIYFTSLVNAIKGVFVSDLDGNIKRITGEGKDYWYDFNGVKENGNKLIGTIQSMKMSPELVSISLKDGSFERITHENDEIFAQLDDVTMEQKWLKTVDGKEMHDWIIYPPHFDSTKVYPAIEILLGGPQGTNSQSWSTRWNYRLMASQGYIVILPNRRGTTAFGQPWCEQISGDYIGKNMQDYLTAGRYIKSKPYVGKLAGVGASYGGYSVYYLMGIHKDLFDCFIAHAGIFNQTQMYMTTEEMWFPNFDNGGAPWDNNPTARRHYANSAHKLIKNWHTPILITVGEQDYRVPEGQGMAAFNAAQMMGVPSKLLLFPEECHFILKPQNSVYWNRVFFEWLDQWCKD